MEIQNLNKKMGDFNCLKFCHNTRTLIEKTIGVATCSNQNINGLLFVTLNGGF